MISGEFQGSGVGMLLKADNDSYFSPGLCTSPEMTLSTAWFANYPLVKSYRQYLLNAFFAYVSWHDISFLVECGKS